MVVQNSATTLPSILTGTTVKSTFGLKAYFLNYSATSRTCQLHQNLAEHLAALYLSGYLSARKLDSSPLYQYPGQLGKTCYDIRAVKSLAFLSHISILVCSIFLSQKCLPPADNLLSAFRNAVPSEVFDSWNVLNESECDDAAALVSGDSSPGMSQPVCSLSISTLMCKLTVRGKRLFTYISDDSSPAEPIAKRRKISDDLTRHQINDDVPLSSCEFFTHMCSF
jgi:hypothetical protein